MLPNIQKMNLIEDLKNLPEPEKTYLEILEVHDKEVPMANLLAFFFRNNKMHGLGDLFIKALLNTNFYELDIKKHRDSTDSIISIGNSEENQKLILDSISDVKVKTEVKTDKAKDKDKRIDILIDTAKFIICIEFKINHILNNPLDTYREHINESYKDSGKQIFYIVLTPSKKEADVPDIKNYLEKNSIFKQVIISHFIKNVQRELPSKFDKNVSFKFYKDFVQTIKNREIRYKRFLLLDQLQKALKEKGVAGKYYSNNKGGFIQIDKNDCTLKIRIENKNIQIESWPLKKEKNIEALFRFDTNSKEITTYISNFKQTLGNNK
jgi:hypothetical protein